MHVLSLFLIVDWFNTDFKVCLTIAGICTVLAIIACGVIRHKAQSRRDGVNLPKPLVALSGDYWLFNVDDTTMSENDLFFFGSLKIKCNISG